MLNLFHYFVPKFWWMESIIIFQTPLQRIPVPFRVYPYWINRFGSNKRKLLNHLSISSIFYHPTYQRLTANRNIDKCISIVKVITILLQQSVLNNALLTTEVPAEGFLWMRRCSLLIVEWWPMLRKIAWLYNNCNDTSCYHITLVVSILVS
jgi:hypothetical protein